MAVVTNTFRSTPEDTPIYSMTAKGSISSTHPEWEIEVLEAPAANIQEEGNDFSFDAITPPSKYGNYAQIMTKKWTISGTFLPALRAPCRNVSANSPMTMYHW